METRSLGLVRNGTTNFPPEQYAECLPQLAVMTQDELVQGLRAVGRTQAANAALAGGGSASKRQRVTAPPERPGSASKALALSVAAPRAGAAQAALQARGGQEASAAGAEGGSPNGREPAQQAELAAALVGEYGHQREEGASGGEAEPLSDSGGGDAQTGLEAEAEAWAAEPASEGAPEEAAAPTADTGADGDRRDDGAVAGAVPMEEDGGAAPREEQQ